MILEIRKIKWAQTQHLQEIRRIEWTQTLVGLQYMMQLLDVPL